MKKVSYEGDKERIALFLMQHPRCIICNDIVSVHSLLICTMTRLNGRKERNFMIESTLVKPIKLSFLLCLLTDGSYGKCKRLLTYWQKTKLMLTFWKSPECPHVISNKFLLWRWERQDRRRDSFSCDIKRNNAFQSTFLCSIFCRSSFCFIVFDHQPGKLLEILKSYGNSFLWQASLGWGKRSTPAELINFELFSLMTKQ